MDKKCTRCKAIKPIEDFGYHSQGRDNRNPNCKQCCIERSKEYAKNNPEKVSETHKRYQREHWEDIKKSKKEYLSTEKGKISERKSDAIQRAKFPEKFRARRAVHNATRRGKIQPASSFSCVVCGKQARHYHHYNGYDKEHRLDVIPVCDPCHKNMEK